MVACNIDLTDANGPMGVQQSLNGGGSVVGSISGGGAGGPRSRRSSSGGGGGGPGSGFRLSSVGLDSNHLQDNNNPCETGSTASRHSVYKQRIDAMFDDSRSVISQRLLDLNSSAGQTQQSGDYDTHEPRVSNSVQARIERMFTEVITSSASSSDDGPANGPNRRGGLNSTTTSCGEFSVRCLGSLALPERVTSLDGLQEPLRQLYESSEWRRAKLDVCAKGLRVRWTGDSGEQQSPAQITPFSGIAVWSAVKFVVDASGSSAAFLPLITDPDAMDKRKLYRVFSDPAQRRGKQAGAHEPIFAVVMRTGAPVKRLECHGFVCDTSEDAIVIAATLYRALMAHMALQNRQQQLNGDTSGAGKVSSPRKPRNRNGVSCVSIASSGVGPGGGGKSMGGETSPTSGGPVRPPRKKRSVTSSLSGDSSCRDTDGFFADIGKDIADSASAVLAERKKRSASVSSSKILGNGIDKSTQPSSMGDLHIYSASMNYLNEQSQRKQLLQQQHNNNNYGRNHQPNQLAPPVSESQYSGDILTRVAIPRSGSFLNAGGLARYKVHNQTRAQRRTGLPGGGGGSPLGFNELFAEFRLQENLHSLDEILGAIVDADGMSFNDLKPIYKEFLLKLAVTLTKDELYQRSKSIMRRQKKKKKKKQQQQQQLPSMNCNVHNGNATITTPSSGNTKTFRDKRKISTNNGSGGRRGLRRVFRFRQHSKTEFEYLKNKKRNNCCTDAADPCENGLQNRNSSSGYVSCSECSYDSESCTCASADRCYCSLGNTHARASVCCCSEGKCCRSTTNTASSGAVCECDSDSCLDAATKCYCRRESVKTGATTTEKSRDRFALDYELFTTEGVNMPAATDSKDRKPHEALSVKKSAEMAALFADVKLNQTTDITHLNGGVVNGKPGSMFSAKNGLYTIQSRTDEKITGTKKNEMFYHVAQPNINQLRRSRAVSGSLEDSLGYLP